MEVPQRDTRAGYLLLTKKVKIRLTTGTGVDDGAGHNLTMRMSMRRFTRLTNAFSKKIDNHCHSIALYFMYYNFVRIHQTLRVTPAMEAGLAGHVWRVEEICALLPQRKSAVAAIDRVLLLKALGEKAQALG